MTCDADSFFITETYSAFEAGTQVYSNTRHAKIARDLV